MAKIQSIFSQPYILLGICFLAIGFASTLSKVIQIKKTGKANRYGIREINKERKYTKQLLALLLVLITTGLIVFIIWQHNKPVKIRFEKPVKSQESLNYKYFNT